MNKDSVILKLLQRYSGHKSGVYTLEAKPNTNILWSGSGDQIVAQWNVAEENDGMMLAKSTGIVYALKFIAQHNHLLIGQSSGGVHVINLETNIEERLLQYHLSPVFHIAHNQQHNLIFTLAGDGTMNVLSALDYHLIKTFFICEGKLRSLDFNPHKNECAIACGDGSIVILSLPNCEPLHRFAAHKKDFSVNKVLYSSDGKLLLSGSRDAMLNVFSTDDYTLVKSIAAHNYAIYDIAFHSSQQLFATASRDKTIKLWNAKTFEVLARIDKEHYDGHTHSVNKLVWMGDKLVSTGDDRTVLVYDLQFAVAN